MTPRLPWLLPARRHQPDVPPLVVAAPAQPAPRRIVPDRYRTGYERHAVGWQSREAAVLDLLADAGGDLTAHRTVHLEDR